MSHMRYLKPMAASLLALGAMAGQAVHAEERNETMLMLGDLVQIIKTYHGTGMKRIPISDATRGTRYIISGLPITDTINPQGSQLLGYEDFLSKTAVILYTDRYKEGLSAGDSILFLVQHRTRLRNYGPLNIFLSQENFVEFKEHPDGNLEYIAWSSGSGPLKRASGPNASPEAKKWFDSNLFVTAYLLHGESGYDQAVRLVNK